MTDLSLNATGGDFAISGDIDTIRDLRHLTMTANGGNYLALDDVGSAVDAVNGGSGFGQMLETVDITTGSNSTVSFDELQRGGAQAFRRAEIQKELGLKDDQIEKIKTISDDFTRQQRELTQGGGAQQNREKIATLRKETTDKIQAVLTEDQKKQWKDMTGEPFQVRRQRPNQSF